MGRIEPVDFLVHNLKLITPRDSVMSEKQLWRKILTWMLNHLKKMQCFLEVRR